MKNKSCNNRDTNLLSIHSFPPLFFFFIIFLEYLRRINLILKNERGCWKSRYTRSKEREELLQQEQGKLKARINYLEK